METFSALLALCGGNSPVTGNSPLKRQWRRALMFSLICAWIKGWFNSCEAGDWKPHPAHYNATLMRFELGWRCTVPCNSSLAIIWCSCAISRSVSISSAWISWAIDYHYGDVIMGTMAPQITSLTIVYSTVYSVQIKENIKSPRHWPLCGAFTGDRWIPHTKGQ